MLKIYNRNISNKSATANGASPPQPMEQVRPSGRWNIDKVAWWIIAILLALLPFHAFLWTWFHSFFWQAGWTIIVQGWKEILIGILVFLAFFKLIQNKKEAFSLQLKRLINKWRNKVDSVITPKKKQFQGRLFWLALIFVFLAFIYALFSSGELSQRIFGLRTISIFFIAFLAVQFFHFSKQEVNQLKKITLVSGAIVIAFSLAQKFLLAPDFLANFGYSTNVSSWLPGGNLPMYHLIGESETIRLQSTFAGPNQLAAYLLVIIPLAFSVLTNNKKLWQFLGIFILCGGILTLFYTYSRSAWLGGLGILLFFTVQQWKKNLNKKLKKKLLFGIVIGITASIVLAFSQPGFRNIIFRQASTSEHLIRSVEASKLVLQNPFGLGIGQSAGVSQRFDTEKNIGITPENTYLGIALELGWLGGILFLALILGLLKELYQAKNPLFYSLLGISIIALLLHPLEDMPTALTLFLLVGAKDENF